MKIHTSRFAAIEIEPDDILFFRNGLLGFEDCRHWVLLADADNAAVAWLQSMQHADIAVPVVSPRRFVSDYQVHLEPADVDSLAVNRCRSSVRFISRESRRQHANDESPRSVGHQSGPKNWLPSRHRRRSADSVRTGFIANCTS